MYILGILILCAACFWAGRFTVKKEVFERSLNIPKNSVTDDDCIKQAKNIGRFLCFRDRYFNGQKLGISGYAIDMIFRGFSTEIIELIRLVHRSGCEIVIRQVDTRDIEACDPNVLEEHIFKLNRKYR